MKDTMRAVDTAEAASPAVQPGYLRRLTAPWVTNSSSAARVKLSWRAAASNAFRALSAADGAAWLTPTS